MKESKEVPHSGRLVRFFLKDYPANLMRLVFVVSKQSSNSNVNSHFANMQERKLNARYERTFVKKTKVRAHLEDSFNSTLKRLYRVVLPWMRHPAGRNNASKL